MADRHPIDVEVIKADEKPEKTAEVDKAKTAQPQVDEDQLAEITPDNPIKLRKPILINGVERTELTWTEDISPEQFMEADSHAHSTRTSISVTEMDNGLQFWLGAMMVCAANPEIDPKDLEQLRGRDILTLLKVGRFLTTASALD